MSSRRKFIRQSSCLAAVMLLRPSLASVKSFKMGIQLYSIREAIEKDIRHAFKTISGFGYEEVETYGFNYGNNKGYWGRDPKEAKLLLDEYQLTSSSGHYDLDKFFQQKASEDEWKKYVDQCIEGAHILKQQYIVWPWLAPECRSLDMLKQVASRLNKIGEPIKKAGLQLAYHNHDFEFIEYDGKIGYDIILTETDPSLVKLEADLYWMSRASKKSPQQWFRSQPGRFPLWHIKDMDKKDPDLHTTVGDGRIDFKALLAEAGTAGAKNLFVEQGNNYVPDDLSCMGRSAAYVKKLLQ
jgi:sugar phosphate isomerase/epimerase